MVCCLAPCQADTFASGELQTQATPEDQESLFATVVVDSTTTFRHGTATLSEAADFALQEVIEKLASYENIAEISIIGHACDMPSDSFNRDMATRRAQSIAYYLRAHGLDSLRLNVIEPGEEYLRYSAADEALDGKSRVELLFVGDAVSERQSVRSPSILEWEEAPVSDGAVVAVNYPQHCVSERPEERSVRLGNFSIGQVNILPTAGFSLGYDSNLTDANAGRQESWFWQFSPAIRIEIPSNRSLLTVSYELELGWYERSSIDDYDDHALLAQWDYDPTNRTALDVFGGYRRGHERRGTGSRQGELGLLEIKPEKFDVWELGGSWRYGTVGARGRIELQAGFRDYEFVNRLEGEANRVFLRDRDEFHWGGAFYWRVAPKTSALLEYGWHDFDYVDADLDSEEERFLVGVTWDATARTSGTVKYGWLEKDFDDPSQGEGYDGSTWEAILNWRPRSYSLVSLKASRATQETDGFGNYLLRQDLSVEWTHNWSTRFSTAVDYGIGSDDHREAVREDDIWYAGLSGRFRLNQYFALGAGVEYFERDSLITEFIYDRWLFLLTVEFSY